MYVCIESVSNRSSYAVCLRLLVYQKLQINSPLLEHCREKLIKVDAQYFKWFLFFAVTTQREAIIFITAEVSTLLTTMLLHFW